MASSSKVLQKTKYVILTLMVTISNRTLVLVNLGLLAVLAWFVFPFAGNKVNAADKAYSIFQDCSSKDDQNKCYKEELIEVTRKKGLTFSQEVLLALQDHAPTTRSCHVIAHKVGAEAVKKNPKEWRKVFEEANNKICGWGFPHGVLEGLLGIESYLEPSSDFLNKVCAESNDREKQRGCSHFFGHLFPIEKGDLNKAIEECSKAIPSLRFDCYDGVFMEYDQKFVSAEHELDELPVITKEYVSGLRNTCLKFTGEQSGACWVEMAEMYAKLNNYEPGAVYAGCMTAPSQSERTSCYLKGVVLIATYPYEQAEKKLTLLCNPYENKASEYKTCISHAIAGLMAYTPKFVPRGSTICSSVEEPYRNWCFEELGNKLKDAVQSPEERVVLCNSVPDKYKPLCSNDNL